MAEARDAGCYGDVFVREVRYEFAGDILPAHTHGKPHITVCCGGRLKVRVRNEPRREHLLEPGQWIEVPPAALHDLIALDPGTVSLCIFSTPGGDLSGTG